MTKCKHTTETQHVLEIQYQFLALNIITIKSIPHTLNTRVENTSVTVLYHYTKLLLSRILAYIFNCFSQKEKHLAIKQAQSWNLDFLC